MLGVLEVWVLGVLIVCVCVCSGVWVLGVLEVCVCMCVS